MMQGNVGFKKRPAGEAMLFNWPHKKIQLPQSPVDGTIQALKWGAGSNVDESAIGSIDEERLSSLVRQHRISSQFLARWRRERPRWCSNSFVISLIEQKTEAFIRLRLHTNALHEITAKLGSDATPLIVVKGSNTYSLTGCEDYVRFSGDIDAFHKQPEVLCDVLGSLGYDFEKSKGHEFAKMNRGGIAVDVHLYIPVVSLPEGITNDLFIPTGIPNHWHQDLAVVQQTQIDYGCLLANSTVSSGAYNPGALIPHPTMAALILCAHIFRTMLDPAFYCPFGVKLHELVEVQALIAHPNFNGDLFLKLISDFRAHDCVKFVGLLLQSYFGRDPFGDCSVYEKSKVEEGIFPRKLTWEGCWASLNSSPDDLLNPFDLASLVKRLGGNAVTATPYERPIVYSLSSQCSGKHIERLFSSSSKKHLEMPVEFSITHDSLGIAVEIFVRESLAAGSHHYRVEMYCNVRYSADNFAYNFNDIPYWEQYMKKAGYSIDPKVMLGADEHMGWLSFKWRDLPEEFTSGKASVALLVIVRWGGANELSREEIQAIAVCPLDITFA